MAVSDQKPKFERGSADCGNSAISLRRSLAHRVNLTPKLSQTKCSHHGIPVLENSLAGRLFDTGKVFCYRFLDTRLIPVLHAA